MSARYDEAALERTRAERERIRTERPHPDPVQRAIRVDVGAACVPPNARKAARYATQCGWSVVITHAVGYLVDPKTGGLQMRDVMEPIGDGSMTEGKNPRLRTYKVGEEPTNAVNSIRVAVRTPQLLIVGYWIDQGWDFGMIISGNTFVRSCNWSGLWEALNAEGGEDMCGTRLPLDGTDGKPL